LSSSFLTIAKLEAKITQLEEKVGSLDEELVEQLREFGIEISAGQVNRLLLKEKASFQMERADGLSPDLIIRARWSQTVCHPGSCPYLVVKAGNGPGARPQVGKAGRH